MLRILFQFSLMVTLAAFTVPAVSSDAEAGKRYKTSHGKSWSGRSGHRFNRGNRRVRGGFILHIPRGFFNGKSRAEVSRGRYINRSGPKIINVQEELRRQRWKEYSN